MLTPARWAEFTQWWLQTADRLGVGRQCEAFLTPQSGALEAFAKVAQAQGDLHYVLFVLIRYWVPPILPPVGKERLAKGDPDYWIESEHILKQAVGRLRELRPFLMMLAGTASGPK